MRLRPTVRVSHLSWAALILLAAGLVLMRPDVTGYGAAMLVGVAMSRALTVLSVARARTAGFEMLWSRSEPLLRATRGHPVKLWAELRNRDTLPTYFRKLSVAHAPALEVSIQPESGEVPAGGSLRVELTIVPRRVGLHGLFSLTLHTIRAPGLFTIPLAFSNPFVFEVLPARGRRGLPSAAGGRSRRLGQQATRGSRKGEGLELHELREHRPGDPYKRIAWKASARRGRLLVIEREQEECDTVWVLLDASIDSASGTLGYSALDRSVDQALLRAEAHLARGDRVGVLIAGSRELARVPPGRGGAQIAKIVAALSMQTHTADADRSEWDEATILAKVREHAASLDRRVAELGVNDVESLEARVRELALQAPCRPDAPWSLSARDRRFRQYLLAFGIQPPPRQHSDRRATEATLARCITEVSRNKRQRASRIVLFAHPPSHDTPVSLSEAIVQAGRRRVAIDFVPVLDLGEENAATQASWQERVALDALRVRERVAARRGLASWARAGALGGGARRNRLDFLTRTK